jgi:hypothetical protein
MALARARAPAAAAAAPPAAAAARGARAGGAARRRALAPAGPCRRAPAPPARVWPFDVAWGVSLDAETLAQTLPQNLFAVSIFPYAGFLFHLTRARAAPPTTLFGFYFLLVFVAATIPAGIVAKREYGEALANVDFLHGGAELFLTVTNLLIVLGLRRAIREAEARGGGGGGAEGGGAEGGP